MIPRGWPVRVPAAIACETESNKENDDKRRGEPYVNPRITTRVFKVILGNGAPEEAPDTCTRISTINILAMDNRLRGRIAVSKSALNRHYN